ncbi:MAG: class I SAM-dependent methyltransferase [Actinomycetota bacterium]
MEVKKAALTWGPALMGGFVWSFAKYPEKLRWATNIYGKSFSLMSIAYENWTKIEGYGEALDAALDEIRTPPGQVLDVATGTGFVATRVARRFPDATIRGVDITPEMVAIAQHQAVADGLLIDFQKADSAALPFDADEFDLVILQNSIVYPEEMLRVVRKGGRVVVVYSFAGPWVQMAWPELARRFEQGGAEYVWGNRAGSGFFGVARK